MNIFNYQLENRFRVNLFFSTGKNNTWAAAAAAAGNRGFAGVFCVDVTDCDEDTGGLDTWAAIIPRGGTAIAGIPGPLLGCIL